MSNSNTQLDLFHGVVLTTEQEQEIATWIEKQAKRAVASNDEVNRIINYTLKLLFIVVLIIVEEIILHFQLLKLNLNQVVKLVLL